MISIFNVSFPLFITFVVLIVMGRKRSLSTNERQRAVGMLQAGQSARRVAGTFGVAPITITRLLNRFTTTNSVTYRARSGRTRVTTQRQDRLVTNLTLRHRMVHAHVLQRELRTAACVNVSDQTFRSRLHAANLRSRRSVVRIPLSRCHRRLRMEWCRPHLWWLLRQRGNLCFSDEFRLNLKFNNGRIRVYQRQGVRFADVNVREHYRYGGGSVMGRYKCQSKN
jgi:transposase